MTTTIERRAGRPWPTHEQALLLRAALGTGAAASSAYAEWRALVDIDTIDGGSFRLLPLLYRNLERQGLAGVDPSVARLKGVYRLSWVRNRTALARVQGLLGLLAEAGIEAQLLKGTALILGHYRDYGVRWMEDCDIFVRPAQAIRAMQIFREAGWGADIASPERILPAIHAANFSNAAGDAVDLHWRPLWECCSPADDGLYWEAPVAVPFGEGTALIPDPARLLLYTCVHGVRWHPTPPFHWIADAFTLVQDTAETIDWERFVYLARRLWLTVTAHAALRHLQRHLGSPVPETVLAALRDTPVPPTLRLEYAVKLGPVQFWPKALIQWSHARRAVGYPHVGRAFVQFPVRLQHLWQLEHLGEVPNRALLAAGRRLSRQNRSVQ
ncbi:MAG TPA: nucleotidyltransferase family protein [Thermomicrobiales bacterium]|jgi:hypothetical protein